MAVSLDRRVPGFRRLGTLAQVVAGGAPREILERVEADWGPTARLASPSDRKEPNRVPGRQERTRRADGSATCASPDGELVAFDDHPTPATMADRSQSWTAGKKRCRLLLIGPGARLEHDGRLWFTAPGRRRPGDLCDDTVGEGAPRAGAGSLCTTFRGKAACSSRATRTGWSWSAWPGGIQGKGPDLARLDGRRHHLRRPDVPLLRDGGGRRRGYYIGDRRLAGRAAWRRSAQASPTGMGAGHPRPTRSAALFDGGETKVFETGGLRIARGWRRKGHSHGAAEPGRGPRGSTLRAASPAP